MERDRKSKKNTMNEKRENKNEKDKEREKFEMNEGKKDIYLF